jgi:integrase
MIQRVYEALQEEYETQQEEGFNTTEIDGMSGFIFTNRFGNIHNPAAVNRAIKRIYEAYNAEELVTAKKEKRQPVIIPHFSCHHFRHTFCSRFCENETNVKVIQTIMGHASIETTMDIYTEVTHDKKQEALEALSKNLDVF